MSEAAVETDDPLEDVREAIDEIRNEGLKAALVHGVVEASLVLIALGVGLSLADVGFVPDAVAMPEAVIESLNAAATSAGYDGQAFPTPYEFSGAIVVAIGLSLVFFVVDVAFVYRSRTVEAFESFNPEVRQALRTARDVAEDDRDDTMTRQLYRNVLERLEDTTSEGFISHRRMAMSLFLIVGIALLVLYASVVGVNFGPGEGLMPGGGGGGGAPDGGVSQDTSAEKQSQWQDANDVLGDAKAVGEGGGQDVGLGLQQSGSTTSGDTGGSSQPGEFPDSSGSVESQRAGYDQQEQIEDADLVKDYNLRVSGDG